MPTAIVKTIGTGGDYADWDAFLAACPTNLVTLDEQWTVKFKKQVHSRAGGFQFTTARTTDATRYFHFTAEEGAAWCDNADTRTSPYVTNNARGATLTSSNGSIYTFECSVNYTKISRLQIVNTLATTSALGALRLPSNSQYCVGDQLILDGTAQNASVKWVAQISGNSGTTAASAQLRNSLVIQRTTDTTSSIIQAFGAAKLYNVTAVSINAKLDVGILTGTLAATLKNVYVGNVTAPEGGATPVAAAKSNCYSDAAATGWSVAPYSNVTFESVTAGSPDFRLKAGSALIDAGTAGSDVPTTDATGTAWSGATDVGAWSFFVADSSAPSMTGTLSSSGVTATGFTVNWQGATDNVGVAGYEFSENGGTTWTDTGNVLLRAFTGKDASTAYTVQVRAYDAAGNKSSALSITVTTAAASGDTTAPSLAGSITPSAITSSGFTFSWPAATDNVAVTGYEVSTNGGTSWTSVGNVLTRTETGKTASTAYQLRVRALDAAGNASTPLSATVTTSAASGGGAAGMLTTQPFKNGIGQVLANLSSLTVAVLSIPALASVKTFSSQTTNGSGVNTINDAAITPGAKYAHVTTNASGTVIGAEIITAT